MKKTHTQLFKGSKWDNTSLPQPFRSRGRRCYSHDCFFRLGRKMYGLTKADSDTEKILLRDFGSYIAIWNAYEHRHILLSPELAAAIKAKIEYLYS